MNRHLRRMATAVAGAAAAQVLLMAPAAHAQVSAYCTRPAHGFVPGSARIPALGRTVRVIQVARTSNNAVGAGPVTEAGKWLMSMDPYTRPSSRRGSVLLSGHTWPDGSALGNALLRDLQAGHRVVLIGGKGTLHACYNVQRRVSYPVGDVPYRKAFRADGPERIVIVACSGKRLGPGNWTHRTLWYATPVFPRTAPPPSPPPGDDDSGSGGLLGGLLGGLF